MENKRILSVESLRGICSLIVMLSHFVVAFYPAAYGGWVGTTSHTASGLDTKLSQSILGVFYAGNFAVCIFFVICGFGLSLNFFGGGGRQFQYKI